MPVRRVKGTFRHKRADGSGRHTIGVSLGAGFSGADTPIFENYFAGGFSTMRGFEFRGASPVDQGVTVGGEFRMLGSVQYMMPLTADDMIKAVTFVDFGTVEENIEIDWDNFRVAPGFGFRISVPALGPAPLAFDFAFPVAQADTAHERDQVVISIRSFSGDLEKQIELGRGPKFNGTGHYWLCFT